MQANQRQSTAGHGFTTLEKNIEHGRYEAFLAQHKDWKQAETANQTLSACTAFFPLYSLLTEPGKLFPPCSTLHAKLS